MILDRTLLTRLFSAALSTMARSSAVAQCVTAAVSGYPPDNSCCGGGLGGAFYPAAWFRSLLNSQTGINRNSACKLAGASVRCIKD